MKKKIFSGIVVLAIAVMAAFNLNLNTESNDMPLLSLANVEALAQESSGGYKSCYSSITKAPDDNSLAVSATSCSDCLSYWVTSASGSSTCK